MLMLIVYIWVMDDENHPVETTWLYGPFPNGPAAETFLEGLNLGETYIAHEIKEVNHPGRAYAGPIKVVFNYDDNVKRWESSVKGAATQTEAKQAFNAVVLTCQQLQRQALRLTEAMPDGFDFKIIPAEIV